MSKKYDELALMAVKWFDYRILTPDQATMACLYHYAVATRYYQKEVGNGSYFNFLVKVDLNNPKDWRGWRFIEKIRQHADSLGLPYDLYWSFAYQSRSKLPFQRSYINVFLNKRLMAMVEGMAARYKKEYVFLSDKPIFSPAKYCGLWIQDLYFDHVIRLVFEVYGRAGFGRVISQMVDDGKLPLEFLRRRQNPA